LSKRSFIIIQFQSSRRQAVCREHLNGLFYPDPTGRYTAEDRRERPSHEVYVAPEPCGFGSQRLKIDLSHLPGVMRVIITARQSLIPSYRAILERLVAIIGETSKNPSNPKFNQYNFESISALTR
jgi:exportin-2 (importin alpha re-exporter)